MYYDPTGHTYYSPDGMGSGWKVAIADGGKSGSSGLAGPGYSTTPTSSGSSSSKGSKEGCNNKSSTRVEPLGDSDSIFDIDLSNLNDKEQYQFWLIMSCNSSLTSEENAQAMQMAKDIRQRMRDSKLSPVQSVASQVDSSSTGADGAGGGGGAGTWAEIIIPMTGKKY